MSVEKQKVDLAFCLPVIRRLRKRKTMEDGKIVIYISSVNFQLRRQDSCLLPTTAMKRQ